MNESFFTPWTIGSLVDSNLTAEVPANRAWYALPVRSEPPKRKTRSEQRVRHLPKNVPRVRLGDLATVADHAERYLTKCKRLKKPPTMAGLCAALGWSAKGLDQFLRISPDSRSGQYLGKIRAEILSRSGCPTGCPLFFTVSPCAVYTIPDPKGD